MPKKNYKQTQAELEQIGRLITEFKTDKEIMRVSDSICYILQVQA
jgi:hypothetical protein